MAPVYHPSMRPLKVCCPYNQNQYTLSLQLMLYDNLNSKTPKTFFSNVLLKWYLESQVFPSSVLCAHAQLCPVLRGYRHHSKHDFPSKYHFLCYKTPNPFLIAKPRSPQKIPNLGLQYHRSSCFGTSALPYPSVLRYVLA